MQTAPRHSAVPGDPALPHHAYARLSVNADEWKALAAELGNSQWILSGLWGDSRSVHMAIWDRAFSSLQLVTLDCPEGHFPSIARLHAPAVRLERTIHDLFGLVPDDTPDPRPWLDHGRWRNTATRARSVRGGAATTYPFLTAEGEGLHQIAVGPVHAGIIEPGHFRFHANGEAIVRLEARLGYAHKGIEHLMQGCDVGRGAKFAARVSGDSTVAFGIAFARAVEAALKISAPPRAHWLRALMAELERLANHVGDIGAICNDASFALMQAHCAVLRELVLRAADECFGHRMMRDCVEPGGVSCDISMDGRTCLRELIREFRKRFPKLVSLYDNTASLQDRTVGAGILDAALASQYGAGGFVGRASGREFDARRVCPYPPYDQLRFDVPTQKEGDVNARLWVRIHEVEQSLSLLEQILNQLPNGPCTTDVPARSGEGLALIEGFRGDILAYVRLEEDGRIARCHLRDPSWFQWPLLEAAIAGNIVADFPLCNKSFNCSYSGHDL